MIISDLFRGRNLMILLCFFCGHSVFHLMGQSFSVLLPTIQDWFGISAMQIGALITVREIVQGLIALPGGMLSDYFSDFRAQLLTGCLVLFGLGWLVIAAAPTYPLLFIGMVIIAASSSLWHLPSLVELSSRFGDNRGTVFAIHGAGGSAGDVIGPVATGLLLLYLSWQQILSFYVILPLLVAGWTYLLFIRLERDPSSDASQPPVRERPRFSAQLQTSRQILKDSRILRVNIVAGLRGMCFTTLVTFLPIYMHDLGFGPGAIGFHFGLLWAIGLVVSPLFGHLSDLFGRKVVLVPALLYSSLLIVLLTLSGSGTGFTVLIILLGLAIRSDYSLINATILDLAGKQVETTLLGILSLFRFLMGAAAPLLAGYLYQYVGMRAALYFVAALFLVAALLFASVRLTPATPAGTAEKTQNQR